MLLVGAAATGGVTFAGAAPPRDPSNWIFQLLPKAFQQNPRLDLTVITEMTAEGKKLPEVDVKHPAYYVAQSGGYRRTVGAPAGGKNQPSDTMDAFARRSLAKRGYYPSNSPIPPSLVLVSSWGVSAQLPRDGTVSNDDPTGNLLDRTGLVGGEKFKAEFTKLLADASSQADAAIGSATRHMTLDGATIEPVLGPGQLEFMSPINRFRESSAKNEFLLEQVGGDAYFVLVSAYPAAALEKNRRVLLWRTKMIVSADGISENDSLPTLINAAAPIFGRDMTEPATLTLRSLPEGSVKLGPLKFLEEEPDAPTLPAGDGPRQ